MGRLEKFSTRGRNRKNRQRNAFIVIACEGNSNNKTERIYFNNFNSKKCIIRFPRGSSTNPVGIVNELIKFIDTEIGREKNDKYYAVFDTDVNKDIKKQIIEALDNGECNPCTDVYKIVEELLRRNNLLN